MLAPHADAQRRRTRPPAPPKPDMAISQTRITPNYAFKGEPAANIRFCDTTSNVGKKRSRPILSKMRVLGPGVNVVVAVRVGPQLEPGTKQRGCGRGRARLGALNLPLGAYDVMVCAEDRGAGDRRPGNDCQLFRDGFFVVKRTLTGAANGTGPFLFAGPLAESWQTNGLTWDFKGPVVRKGRFEYTARGSVSYRSVMPSTTGCARQGAQTDFAPTGTLTLDYGTSEYQLVGRTSAGFTYAVVGECDPADGPANPIWADSGIGTGRALPLPFGTEVIAGRREEDETVYNWSFS